MFNFIGFYTLTKREILRFYKVIGQTVLSPVITNILFLIIFNISLKNRIVLYHGFNYMQFLVPGLIIMAMITNAFSNSASSLMIAKYNNSFTDFLIIPITGKEFVLALMIGGVFRGFLIGLSTYLTTLIFVKIPVFSIINIIIVSFFVSSVFALIGCIAGFLATDFDQIATLMNFILYPLVFLGGVFYSMAALPSFFQKITFFNPMTYFIDLLRYSFLGVSDINPIISYAILLACFMILFFISKKIFDIGYKIKN